MSEQLKGLLAEDAARAIHEGFSGVRAEWWWERRITGGIAVCQELDPEAMLREVSRTTGHPEAEVRRAIEEELGLEDFEPVVLTYEIEGEASPEEVTRRLRERAAPEGLAAGLYARVAERLTG